MPDTHNWITQICDADLRRIPGHSLHANVMTLEDVTELYTEYQKRKAAMAGG